MRSGGVLTGLVLLVALGLMFPALGALAQHQSNHFERSYEGSHTIVWGAPGQGGAFIGTVFCNADTNGPSTGACVRYNTGQFDFSGGQFEVTLTDLVFGQQASYIVGFDLTGSGNVDCTGPGGGPDLCYFGSGTLTGDVPANAGNEVLWVFPATVHLSAFPCCPQSAATAGDIEITFHP